MLAFASLLIPAAKAAGMTLPPNHDSADFDEMNWDKDSAPHFFIFCQLQLGRSMMPGEQFENAVKIAALDIEKIKTMTMADFEAAGLV